METLYLKIDQNVEVDQPDITLGNICKMTCADNKIVNRLKLMKIIKIKDQKFSRYTVSVLAVIQKIHEIYPQLEVNNIGEAEFLLTYRKPKKANIIWGVCKIVIVCCTIFFGAAFTIMTFNNDVGVSEVFEKLYEMVMGQPSDGFTILEVTYSLGISIGIIVFFNHFFGRRLTTDPTPIEVDMKLYEKDVNTMLIETCTRKEYQIDVD